jgi:hypothetical protein
MSRRSTRTPLRFYLLGVALWLSPGSAIAQDAPDITLRLSPAQVAEIIRLIDMQPISQSPPPAFWDLQVTISNALSSNPEALRAVTSARSPAR